jgi:hypothetical protein
MVGVAIVAVLLFALVFSFRETVRGVAEFFDFRAVHCFLRRPWRASLIIGGVVALFALFWVLVSGPHDSPLLFLALAPLIAVPGLALFWLIVCDISQGIRENRRRSRRRRKDR